MLLQFRVQGLLRLASNHHAIQAKASNLDLPRIQVQEDKRLV